MYALEWYKMQLLSSVIAEFSFSKDVPTHFTKYNSEQNAFEV